jgi:predicted aminopeptidase
VVAAAEFSLKPKQWCFPVAGCVSYRGYFKQQDAKTLASSLKARNYDIDLYGVQAYSTLSWFNDPVLNTFINSSDSRLAGLLFHELAHQLIYIDDDTPFNEAFAMTVQIEGVQRWFQQMGNPEEWQKFLEQQAQGERFRNYLKKIHNQLDTLYQQDLPTEQMRTEKHRLISQAIADFDELKSSGQLNHHFDQWMSRGLNNARLAGIATYRELIPGFQRVLRQCQGDFNCFYTHVKKLGKLSRTERLSQLKQPH